MTTPQREWKNIQRRLRSIPVERIAPAVAAWERDGMWCLVGGVLTFVPADGGTSETSWSDPLEYAQFLRYVESQPERIHPSMEAARTFVRSRPAPEVT